MPGIKFLNSGSSDPKILFGIPLFVSRIEDFSRHKSMLLNIAYALRAEDDGLNRSNSGGWHSGLNVHLDYKEQLGFLTQGILDYSNQSVGLYLQSKKYGILKYASSWFNINSKGSWNLPHTHFSAAWSGVLYVQTGSNDLCDDLVDGGDILFMNPASYGAIHGSRAFNSFRPMDGDVYLFPSYLLHMVTPFFGEDERISLAFNLKFDR